MSSSYTDFRGHGFWEPDGLLEVWLYHLAQEVHQLDAPPEWLQAVSERWHLLGTNHFSGITCADLDEYCLTTERVELVIEVCERATARLEERGVLPAEFLNSAGIGGPGHWTADRPVEWFVRVGKRFVKLLRGQIDWIEYNDALAWGALLALEVPRLDGPPPWLLAAAENWGDHHSVFFGFDDAPLLADTPLAPGRARVLEWLSEFILGWLHSQGESVPASVLNSVLDTVGVEQSTHRWENDVPTERITRVGELYLLLVKGEIDRSTLHSAVFQMSC